MFHLSTDYHLGKVLSTHTTPFSRKALTQAIFDQGMKVTQPSVDSEEKHFVCGDLVDKYRNDETIIEQALTILSRIESCLMGNHDVTNRADSMGTMELLESLAEMVPAVMNQCMPIFYTVEDTHICMVPHTNTQALFEQALEVLVAENGFETEEILILHCNYELPWEKNETTLNLTEEMALELLERFDYILIGHEHNHRTALDGRVVLLGNIFPIGFADISDKFRWTYTDSKLTKHLIWEKEKHYVEIEPLFEEELGSDIQFVSINGTVDAADYPAYCRSLSKLWKANGHVFAIRNNVEIITKESSVTIDQEALKNLTQTILDELDGQKEMKVLFAELLEEIES